MREFNNLYIKQYKLLQFVFIILVIVIFENINKLRIIVYDLKKIFWNFGLFAYSVEYGISQSLLKRVINTVTIISRCNIYFISSL